MVSLTEPGQLSLRTRLFLAFYLGSGGLALLMIVWVAVVTIIYFTAGERAVESLPAGIIFPWLPIAVVVLFLSKFALIWSSRKDRRGDRS